MTRSAAEDIVAMLDTADICLMMTEAYFGAQGYMKADMLWRKVRDARAMLEEASDLATTRSQVRERRQA